MAKIYRKESFLRNATSDSTGQFLGLNNTPRIPASSQDVEYVLECRYEERPDILAYEIYGSTRYWWVFSARNPDVLKDPIRDFRSGITIMLPIETNVLIGNSSST
jgi:hypothetical protein